ncbi:MAG: hypothetical protein KDB00_09250 [Planctomycetales bacterium]|nr:hypothetical protein [Planctomycetales bacterium]
MRQNELLSESAGPAPRPLRHRWQLGVAILVCFFVAVDSGGNEPQEKTGGDTTPSVDTELAPVESVDAATRSMWLIDGIVIDADTSKKIDRFTVTPGSLSTDDAGKSMVRWRDNLKREMTEGRLRWPRTSGFSVMRFRVSADSYIPVTTQRIWRGGPHTRVIIRMKQIKEDSNPPLT